MLPPSATVPYRLRLRLELSHFNMGLEPTEAVASEGAAVQQRQETWDVAGATDFVDHDPYTSVQLVKVVRILYHLVHVCQTR